MIRRSCLITAGYELNAEEVETALLEAAGKVEGVLKDPKPIFGQLNLGTMQLNTHLRIR